MGNFLKIQLNRACYISLLNIEDTTKGIFEYKNYIKKLNLLALNPFLLAKVVKEKQQAKKIFSEKMGKIAKKYFDEKNYAKTIEVCQVIFENDSKNIENLKLYIKCLKELEQYDLAVSLNKNLANATQESTDYKELSNLYLKIEDYPNAIANYKKMIKMRGKKEYGLNDFSSLGYMYFNLYTKISHKPDDILTSDEYFRKALDIAPTNKHCLKNAIFSSRELKDYKREQTYWNTYFENNYADKKDEFVYSSSSMMRGDVETWAKYYESRHQNPADSVFKTKVTSKPRYTGEQDISDKTLLVLCEQGYGDTFLMYGHMGRLTKIAKKVIFYVQDYIYDLLKDNDLGVEIQCYATKDKNEIEHDYFMLCMSIPYVLRLNRNNISVGGGYIQPKKELIEQYKKEYFDNKKYKIAIAFEGNKDGARKRDIPLKYLKLLDKLNNVQLYCFTKDVKDEELKCFKRNKVINIAKSFEDFACTAAALENCDLIITSDNCILNLAGAIGKKTFGIFNYHYEFRWYDLSGEDCGWFKSVKPFVNDEYNNWTKTILKVIKEVGNVQKNG